MQFLFIRKEHLIVTVALLLAGCGGVSVWPFGDEKKPQAESRGPANSTEYQCDAGKKFYVRLMDNGNSAWLILPDREVALAKVSASRYSNNISTLNINDNEATLDDGSTSSYTACKTAGKTGK